jgi:hypothetical protein
MSWGSGWFCSPLKGILARQEQDLRLAEEYQAWMRKMLAEQAAEKAAEATHAATSHRSLGSRQKIPPLSL